MYESYLNFIMNALSNEKLYSQFKSNNDYRGILEHVSQNQGQQYYELIKNEFNITNESIIDFVNLNDRLGCPIKYNINNIICSPTSLRYIYHALIILKYIKSLNLNNLNIVEIGGGYGGLCLAINYFQKFFNLNITEYNIIDLDQALKLQQKYLLNFNDIKFNINYISSSTYGKDLLLNNYFLISNYCYSEITEENKPAVCQS